MYQSARSLSLASVLVLLTLPATAQETVYWDEVADIRREAFENSHVTDNAGFLTDVIGPRLTCSPNMRQAQDWAHGQIRELG